MCCEIHFTKGTSTENSAYSIELTGGLWRLSEFPKVELYKFLKLIQILRVRTQVGVGRKRLLGGILLLIRIKEMILLW